MSLSDRLNRMEATIRQQSQELAALREVVGDMARDQVELASALAGDDAGQDQPERTLDGDIFGGERDQSQSLG